MRFIDTAYATLKSGKGGNGNVSFVHKASRVGAPDGGNGGKGGNIILTGNKSLSDLSDYRYSPKIFAENGHHGSSNKKFGRSGKNKIVELPFGTEVWDDHNNMICEIMDEEKILLLNGGKGGAGNYAFKSSINRSPISAEEGQPGMLQNVKFVLKLLADFCLVGMPNAGKSSLINFMTNTNSKVGNYSFTTVRPYLGTVEHKYHRMTILDIPGIIYGASQGKGMGLEIMKHGERCNTILHVVDSSADDPIQNYHTIREELNNYKEYDFSLKKEIILLSKYDKSKISCQEFQEQIQSKTRQIQTRWQESEKANAKENAKENANCLNSNNLKSSNIIAVMPISIIEYASGQSCMQDLLDQMLELYISHPSL